MTAAGGSHWGCHWECALLRRSLSRLRPSAGQMSTTCGPMLPKLGPSSTKLGTNLVNCSTVPHALERLPRTHEGRLPGGMPQRLRPRVGVLVMRA